MSSEESSKCEHNNCGTYHYPNGTCMNKSNVDNHFEECKQEGCEYETVQMVQESDTQESQDM